MLFPLSCPSVNVRVDVSFHRRPRSGVLAFSKVAVQMGELVGQHLPLGAARLLLVVTWVELWTSRVKLADVSCASAESATRLKVVASF